MRILGIDPALTTTGFGLIEYSKDKVSFVTAGVIKTEATEVLSARLEHIYTSVNRLIREEKPCVLVLEKIYAHYQHPATAFVLGHARGIICLAAAQARIPVCEYAATQVKKAIVGRGLASKEQIRRMVCATLRITAPKYTDVTDALALAVAFSHTQKPATARIAR